MKPGDIVANRYRLRARIGSGGMGDVWSAAHTATDREFAVKLIHPHLAASEELRVRFSREARAAARIDHPAVVDVLDVGETEDGGLYLVMDLLTGVTLHDALHGEPRLSLHDFLSIMLDTTRALVAAHAVGVVHRDLKPPNIFLHRDRMTGLSSARILDFGISKFLDEEGSATRTDGFFGSPHYMSPEQVRAPGRVDHRTDLWSIGVILFEGFTGTYPHDAKGVAATIAAICTTPPTDIDRMVPDLPESLRAIVRACLAPIERRLARTAELAERIEAALREPGLATIPLPRPFDPRSDNIPSNSELRLRPPSQERNALPTPVGASEPGSSTTAAAARPAPLSPSRVASSRPMAVVLLLSALAAVLVLWRLRATPPLPDRSASSAAISSLEAPLPPPGPVVSAREPLPASATPSASVARPVTSAIVPRPTPRRPSPAQPKPEARPRPSAQPPEMHHDPFKEM